MKTRSIACLAASLLMLTVSTPGYSQDGAAAAQDGAAQDGAEQGGSGNATDEATSEEAAADGAEQTDQPAEDGAASDEAAGGEEAAAAEGADQAGEPVDGAQANAEGDAKGDKATTGPGGKPLREDYPGTDESKKSRMDTERIEGLQFDEGDKSDEEYDTRIRELETKVDDLKEKVFRSKSRIVLLKETVLTGNLAGSRAIVSHINDLGGAYQLKRAHYTLDGSRIYNRKDQSGDLDDEEKVELYNGSISPGSHRVSILLELKGSGYGLFSYMDSYKFTIKDSCEFTAQEGRSAIVKVRLFDKGGAFSSYEERPGIECVLSSVKLTGKGLDEGEKKDKDQPDSSGAAAKEPAAENAAPSK